MEAEQEEGLGLQQPWPGGQRRHQQRAYGAGQHRAGPGQRRHRARVHAHRGDQAAVRASVLC